MVQRCVVLECSTTSKFPTHHFPKDPVMFKTWRAAVESSRTVNATDDELRKRRVCHLHFRERDYHMDFKTRRLKPFAVPSLNIPISDIQQAPASSHFTDECIEVIPNPVTSHVTEECTEVVPDPVSSHVTRDCIEVIPDPVSRCDVEEIPQSFKTTSQTNIIPPVALQNIAENAKPTLTKNIRKRIHVPRISTTNMTPQNTKLLNTVLMLKKQHKKMQRQILSYQRRLRLAKNVKEQNKFQKMFSSLTPVQRNFIGMQLRLLTVSPKGRRFTQGEKLLARSIYKQLPGQYKWLSLIFPLPSVKTLNK